MLQKESNLTKNMDNYYDIEDDNSIVGTDD